MTRALTFCGAAFLAAVTTQGAQPNPQGLARSLLRLSDPELAAFSRGQPVVKTLPPAGRREVVTAGGIRVQGPALAFVTRYRTLEGFRTSEFVLQISKFSEEPSVDDLRALTLEDEDVQALRRCRVGSCKVRLSAAAIQRFNQEIDWSAPDAKARATALFRLVLLDQLAAYRKGGTAALPPYQDGANPLRVGDEITSLLDAKPSLLEHAPPFAEYFRRYPETQLPGTEDFFYWSKEAFGFKPVIGLNHVSMFLSETDSSAIIASKQIYASHYMDGSIAITALTSDPGPENGGFYWMYLNRSRIGRLQGLLGGIARGLVQSRARAGLEKSLRQTKLRMEKN